MSDRARLTNALAAASLAMVGCLPVGNPPSGRQILADPTAALVEILPALGDGMVRVLYFKPGQDGNHIDLWVVATDANGGNASERLLFTGLDADYQVGSKPAARNPLFNNFLGYGGDRALTTDARGRVYLPSSGDSSGSSTVQIDPVTGETHNVGAGFVSFTQDGQRILVNSPSQHVVLEPDDTETVIDSQNVTVLGNAIFYLTDAGDLMRSQAGTLPEVLAMGLSAFYPGSEQIFLLQRGGPPPGQALPDPFDPSPDDSSPTSVPAKVTATILDTTTLQETPLPDGPDYSYPHFSSDTRWIQASGDTSLVIVDRLNGTVESFEPSDSAEAGSIGSGWRPGHADLWGTTLHPDLTGLDRTSVWIKAPGQPIVTVPATEISQFTPDGAYWISPSVGIDDGAQSSEVIGPADDPTAPRRPVVPHGTSMLGLWQLSDGRVVTMSESSVDVFDDYYIQLVDPMTGATSVLGQHGYLAAVGATRVLGLFDYSFQRGDLTAVDTTVGETTVLAPEFAMAAVMNAQGSDGCPPGGAIVYQFRARFASPWDGLWLTTNP